MIFQEIERIEKDIKSLTIQGATNIALSVLEGIKIAAQNKVKSWEQLYAIGEKLAYARPTEPLAQNALRFLFAQKGKPPDYYIERIHEYISLVADAKEKMAGNGASFVQNGGVYLTHCHSSTVVSMFEKARKIGRRFSVFTTETRPRFQGRKTAQELLEAGIEDVTLIIDDVAESLLEGRAKTINAVFIGADLLSEDGFVNKVGSLGISFAAQRRRIPFYCLSVLLKYDPRPYSPSVIEQRGSDEIWPDAPANLSFYSPAFDFVPYKTGVKIICEEGLVNSKDISKKACSLYSFLKTENGKPV